MKHLLSIFLLFALNANAQDILVRQGGGAEKVKVLKVTPTIVKYLKIESATDSVFTELCSNLFYIRYQDGKLKTFNFEQNNNTVYDRHLYKAGDAIRKSTSCMLGAIGTSLASGTCFALAGLPDDKNVRTTLIVVGGITAALSLGLGIASIHYQFKSGRELRLSAGEVVFKF